MPAVVFGWGGKLKHAADLSIKKCSNCKNYTPFHLGVVKKAVRVYFIPVIPYSKKYYIVCGLCEAAWGPLDQHSADTLLAESAKLPSNEESIEIWNSMMRIIRVGATLQESPQETLERALLQLTEEGHSEVHVAYIGRVLLEYLADDDRPK